VPKPRRTSAQVVADHEAAQAQAEARSAMIAEKRRQLAELEAEEALAEQAEHSTFVRNVGDIPSDGERMEVDDDEPTSEVADLIVPETRLDAETAVEASEHESTPPEKVKKGKGRKKGKEAKDVVSPTAKDAKGKKKSAGKKDKVSDFFLQHRPVLTSRHFYRSVVVREPTLRPCALRLSRVPPRAHKSKQKLCTPTFADVSHHVGAKFRQVSLRTGRPRWRQVARFLWTRRRCWARRRSSVVCRMKTRPQCVQRLEKGEKPR
jgi:hypothetical protein